MKRHGFTIIVFSVIMAALISVCFAADELGIGNGRLFSGRSGVYQGWLDLFAGSSSAPAYIHLESTAGTDAYIFADDDGGIRYATAVPVDDSNGVALTYDVNSVTADVNSLSGSRYYIIDSSGGAMDPNLYDGESIGDTVTIMMKVAGNNCDVSIEHHVTSDPEVIRFDAAGETADFVWDGTDWVAVRLTGATYP